jgi:hypothetical protein
MFSTHTKVELGDGFKIKFLHDVWCWGTALRKFFWIYLISLA